MENTVKFFLGANSDNGFISYFKQLQECPSMQLLILKGGPGSGKSTLMKRVASYAVQRGNVVETIPCASDTESIDGIIDRTAGFAMIDGTAPHTEDPVFPGVTGHIMYTGDLWDTQKLRKKGEETAFFSNVTSDYHSGATAYIKAAGSLMRENLRIAKSHVSPNVKKFVLDVMKDLPDGDGYKEEKRLLSAVTTGEIRFLKETIPLLADDVYIIEDDLGGVSEAVFSLVKSIAQIKGMKIILCPCSIMADKIDHIIIPDGKVAFSKNNGFLKGTSGKRISADMFYTDGIDKTSCTRRIQDAKKLLDRAATLVKSAKKSHDSLEKYYAQAMNFEGTDDLFNKITTMFYK